MPWASVAIQESFMGKASRKKRERQGMHLTLPPSMQGAMKIRRHHEGTKISSSLGDLIDPYSMDDMTLDQFRKLVMAGAIAWNLSTFDEPRRTEELDRFVQAIGTAHARDFEAVIRVLLARKLTHFPDDFRFIVAWDVKQNHRHFHITAAAIVPNADSKELENPDRRETVSV
jgi:hypothetical protein